MSGHDGPQVLGNHNQLSIALAWTPLDTSARTIWTHGAANLHLNALAAFQNPRSSNLFVMKISLTRQTGQVTIISFCWQLVDCALQNVFSSK